MNRLLDTRMPGSGSEITPPREASPPASESDRARGYLALLRLALGGGICGGFLGIFGGALLGTLYGICVNDMSRGLDGALLGSAVLAVLGAFYGLSHGRGAAGKILTAADAKNAERK